MARKTRAQIADEELTQQIIEKASRRSEASKQGAITKKLRAEAKSPGIYFDGQKANDGLKKSKAATTSDNKLHSIPGDSFGFSKGDKVEFNADSDSGFYKHMNEGVKGNYSGPDRTATPPRQDTTRVTNSGKMYTAKPKGKRGAIRAALEVGHRMLNKYVDVDGVVEGIAKNKAATAAGAAAVGTAAAAHHIKERQKEQQSDEDE